MSATLFKVRHVGRIHLARAVLSQYCQPINNFLLNVLVEIEVGVTLQDCLVEEFQRANFLIGGKLLAAFDYDFDVVDQHSLGFAKRIRKREMAYSYAEQLAHVWATELLRLT